MVTAPVRREVVRAMVTRGLGCAGVGVCAKAIVAVQMQANIVTEAILNFQLIIDRHAPGVASALLQW